MQQASRKFGLGTVGMILIIALLIPLGIHLFFIPLDTSTGTMLFSIIGILLSSLALYRSYTRRH